MNKEIENWLLSGEPWLKYCVETQILSINSPVNEAVNSKDINTILKFLLEDDNGLNSIINGSASYTKEAFWYLYFLADIGFKSKDLGFDSAFQKILELENENNRFLLSKEMKPDFFCISSIVLYSIAKMSLKCKEKLKPHVELLLSMQRLDGGWHCAKSRAVGKKLEDSDSCPMDNLNVLLLLSEYEDYRVDPRLNGAIDLLLNHWAREDEQWRPYGFGVGSQFKKLRYPESKYGILRVVDLLSKYPYALSKDEFHDMFAFIKSKQINGKYKAESVVKAFSAFDFSQKKEASRWITFLIERIEKRIKDNN